MIRKVVVAPDSFKESLSAIQAARAIERGLRIVDARVEVDIVPMADGGEGTVEAMTLATGGRIIRQTVTGPTGRAVEAYWGLLGDGHTAVIEMAAASGLPLVPPDQRNPMLTTTYGTGELIRHALDHPNVTQLIIAVGGSATTDGGCGAAQALGVRLLDRAGRDIPSGGQGLAELACIDTSGAHPRLTQTQIRVACDVDNPLTGPNGAAAVYSPQKGASPEMVQQLDRNLHHLAEIIRRDLGIDVETVPGAGAAGGLAAGLVAFCNAALQSGSQLVSEAVRLEQRLAGAELCITGEGKLDDQSLSGKTAYQVAKLAHKQGVPAIALVGAVGPGAEKAIPPLTAYVCILTRPMELQQALEDAQDMLTAAAEQVLRLVKLTN